MLIKKMKSLAIGFFQWPVAICLLPLYAALALIVRAFKRRRKIPRLCWGPVPIISNAYWSAAMKEKGYPSFTLMENYFSAINKRQNFDRYYTDFIPDTGVTMVDQSLIYFRPYIVFLYVLLKADILHFSFNGFVLYRTVLQSMEPHLYALAGIKTVVIPFGADFYQYSLLSDPTLKQALLLSYPGMAKKERQIRTNIHRWTQYADCIVGSFHLDGLGRWDVLSFVPFMLDTEVWKQKSQYSDADGKRESVVIVHCPNHTGFKGTEFIVQAIQNLKRKGYRIEFKQLQKIQNEMVREHFQQADILVEQLLANTYSLNAIEGMASGLAVIANLEPTPSIRLFQRYSYAGSCPIVSASIETLEMQLEALIIDPKKRQEIGNRSRSYVEKYHSYAAAQWLFDSIYQKIWFKKDLDLMRLYQSPLPE